MSADFRGPMEWLGAIIDDKETPPPAQFKVLSCLARTMDWKTGTGYASEPYLAEMSGIKDLRTVRAALAWARANDFAVRTRKGHRINDQTAVASEWQLAMPSQEDIGRTVGTAELGVRPDPTGHRVQASRAVDAANSAVDVPPSSLSSSSLATSSLSDNSAQQPKAATRRRRQHEEEEKVPRADVGSHPARADQQRWYVDAGQERYRPAGRARIQNHEVEFLGSEDDLRRRYGPDFTGPRGLGGGSADDSFADILSEPWSDNDDEEPAPEPSARVRPRRTVRPARPSRQAGSAPAPARSRPQRGRYDNTFYMGTGKTGPYFTRASSRQRRANEEEVVLTAEEAVKLMTLTGAEHLQLRCQLHAKYTSRRRTRGNA